MNKLAVIISPNYKDYARKYLAECMASLRAQTYKDFDIFLIDNQSSVESRILMKELAPEGQLIALDANEGFAGGNNAVLREIMKTGYEWAFLLNMDTVSAPDLLEKIMKAAYDNSRAGALQARLMLYQAKDKINSLGNEIHFLGFGFCRAYGDVYNNSSVHELYPPIAYPSGAAVLLNIRALDKVGLFDEEMWMYNEDQDLGWRLWLAGYECRLASQAIVYHKYEFSRSITKYYWMDRNRLLCLLKNYHALTILCVLPALAIMEMGLALFSLQSGWWKEKLRVWKYFLTPRSWRYILGERRRIQSSRLIKEKKVAPLISGRIWYQEIGDAKLRLINPIFDLYWKIVRGVMWW